MEEKMFDREADRIRREIESDYYIREQYVKLLAENKELREALRKILYEASQFPKDVVGHETISGLCARVAREVLSKFNQPNVQGGQSHE